MLVILELELSASLDWAYYFSIDVGRLRDRQARKFKLIKQSGAKPCKVFAFSIGSKDQVQE